MKPVGLWPPRDLLLGEAQEAQHDLRISELAELQREAGANSYARMYWTLDQRGTATILTFRA